MPRPRRFSTVLVLLGVLVVLGAVAVGADRVAAHVTAAHLASRLESAADASDVDASVRGFPFLTQVARGRLDHVVLDAGSATFAGLTVAQIHADAHDVETDAPNVVGSATVEALVPTATLQQAVDARLSVPVTLTAADDGLHAAVTVAGVPATLVLAPRVDGEAVAVDVAGLEVAGLTVDVSRLPGAIRDQVSGLRVPLDLPDGVRVTGVDVVPGDAGGVRIAASAANVPLGDLAGRDAVSPNDTGS